MPRLERNHGDRLFFCWLILPLGLVPIGLMMFDRTGAVMTLLRY